MALDHVSSSIWLTLSWQDRQRLHAAVRQTLHGKMPRAFLEDERQIDMLIESKLPGTLEAELKRIVDSTTHSIRYQP